MVGFDLARRRPAVHAAAVAARDSAAALALHIQLAGQPWYIACGVLYGRMLVGVMCERAAWSDRLMPEVWRGYEVGTVVGWWRGWGELPRPVQPSHRT